MSEWRLPFSRTTEFTEILEVVPAGTMVRIGTKYELPSGRRVVVVARAKRCTIDGWQCWYVDCNGQREAGRPDEHSVMLRDDWLRVHGVAV